mgnify:CR=1 FL=1
MLDNVIVGADNTGETITSVVLGRWRATEKALNEKAREVLARVGLADRINDLVSNLSGGELRMVEHNLQFLLRIADSIIVLQHGELLAEGTPQEIKSDKKVIAAYLGAEHAA